MKYATKRDPFFIGLWAVMILLINLVCFGPLLLEDVGLVEILVVSFIALVTSGFMIWMAAAIYYVIGEKELLVRGGPFRSRIAYSDITRITGKPNIWMGYRLLFSRDAIEIHYKTGFMGSVIISPANQGQFIQELLRRNDSIQVEEGLL